MASHLCHANPAVARQCAVPRGEWQCQCGRYWWWSLFSLTALIPIALKDEAKLLVIDVFYSQDVHPQGGSPLIGAALFIPHICHFLTPAPFPAQKFDTKNAQIATQLILRQNSVNLFCIAQSISLHFWKGFVVLGMVAWWWWFWWQWCWCWKSGGAGVVVVVVVPPPPPPPPPLLFEDFFWHQPENFDTCTAGGAGDKYEVWLYPGTVTETKFGKSSVQ